MRRWRKSAWTVCGAAVLLALSYPAARAAACDEYDPAGPAAAARIALDESDSVDESGDELRTFVATDSIGRVDVGVASASPPGIVRSVSAVPEVSRISRYHGEALKGVAVVVAVVPGRRPARVVIDLRQVCAKHFRNTFLYY